MDEHLAELLAAATVEIAAQRNITLEEVAMFVRERFRRLRAKYQDAGAPNGDTNRPYALANVAGITLALRVMPTLAT
jgi:hypothetical protein